MRQARSLVTLTLILACCSIVAAHEPEAIPGDVRLTFKLVGVNPDGGQTERTYQMVVKPSGHPARIVQGSRFPIPTTTFNTQSPETGAIAPVTSFSYQDVGFTASAEVKIVEGRRVHLKAQVEDSSIAAREPNGGQPMIATVNQSLEVTLKDGVSTRVAWVDNSRFGSMFLEITAEILD